MASPIFFPMEGPFTFFFLGEARSIFFPGEGLSKFFFLEGALLNFFILEKGLRKFFLDFLRPRSLMVVPLGQLCLLYVKNSINH